MENVSLESRLDDAKFRRRLYIGLNIASLFGFAGLMAVAAFYDLQISQAIGDMNNLFGTFFEVVGEAPSYLVLPFCAPIFFYNAKNFSDKRFRIFMRVFGLVLSWLGYFMWIYAGTKPGRIDVVYGIPGLTMFAVFGGFVGGALGLWVGSLIKPQVMERLLKFAVFSLVFMVAALLVMQGLKMLWGRMRFRDMLAAGSYEGFTPWYVVNVGGTEETFKSFPSGHTSSAANIFILAAACDVFPKLRSFKARAIINSFCAVFVMVVAVSRIVNCAHFLSDVLVGGYGTYLIFVLVRYLFFGKGKYEYDLSRFKQEGEVKPCAAEEAQAGAGDAERENAPAETEGAGEGGNTAVQEQATEREPEEKAAAQTESDE